jgi:molybdate transport system ATP-binding protein
VSGIRARFRGTLGTFRLDADFEAPSSGVTALFGASGSGKTTVLRCVAGLERVEQGRFWLDDACWQDQDERVFVPPHKRPIGYVFQEPSLFPHLSVRRNLDYGLRRVPASRRRVDLEQAVELLGVTRLLDRGPERLSGGERQRVAMARALLTSPSLLLMDEPLAALDTQSKAEILPYLERLHAELSIPVLYVSHSPDEVARLADYMVLMEAGRVSAQGPLSRMMTRLDLPLARGEHAEALLEGVVAGHDEVYHLTEVSAAGAAIVIPREDLAIGQRVRLRIQARDVSLALMPPERSSIVNVVPARVAELDPYAPGQVSVRLLVDGAVLLARVTERSVDQLGLEPGREVYAQVKGVALAGR